MRFCNAFLANLWILLATIVTAEKSTRATIPDVAHTYGRLLRKVDAEGGNTIATEERGAWPSVKRWGKMQFWLAAGKSDDQVEKALKMEGLTGAALKSHPNYKRLQKFLYKREGREMDAYVRQGVPTRDVWDDLGLATMTAAQRKNSDELRRSVRYATKYDDEIWTYRNTIAEVKIHYGGSPAEMEVKVQIWAKAERKKGYVEEMLGLDRLPKAARKTDPAYVYFLQFLQLTERSR